MLVAASVCCALLIAAWIRLRHVAKARPGAQDEYRPRIGAAASARALQRVIELFPDCRTIDVVDRTQNLIGIIVVADVRDILSEIANESAIVVADLMMPAP